MKKIISDKEWLKSFLPPTGSPLSYKYRRTCRKRNLIFIYLHKK